MRNLVLATASALSLALAACTPAAEEADAPEEISETEANELIAAAVSREDRPNTATELDEGRKPAETLAFLGLRPGMDAADLFTGAGYWAEMMAHVVGEEGSVVGLQPLQFYNTEEEAAAWAELEKRAPGTSMTRIKFGAFDYPADSFDFMIFNLNYHDIYWESERFEIEYTEPAVLVQSMYKVMRPGGIVGVIDHVGKSGDTRKIVDETHRIDPAVVIADFEKEGFELVGQSDLLANPDDDHTLDVFDEAIRGKTDRFLLKFRKPAN